MKKILVLIAVVILAVLAWKYLGVGFRNFITPDGEPGSRPQSGESFQRGGEEWVRYTDDEVLVQFEYRDEPNGYTLVTPQSEGDRDTAPVKTFLLFDKEEYKEFQNSTEPREGPTGISIMAYQPGPNVTPNEWIVQSNESNYREGTVLQTGILLDNKPAVRYKWDGLYSGESVVVARKGWIYVFSVTWIDSESQTVLDFEELIKSAKIL